MTPDIIIREETDADILAIREVTVAAFDTPENEHLTEHLIVEALRAADAMTVSMVAEVDGRVVGHVAFSPVTISDGATHWYGLGPISVLPEYQRKGIGAALIHKGLTRLKTLDAKGCCLVGHPAYYVRFGFENVAGLVYEGVSPKVFFALSFDGRFRRGPWRFMKGSM